ncbi:MAG: MBOAT family protein [Chlorobi bacterium]|nr:MBOAT family protein [Chlorobiota bacterium]
MVFSSIVFVLFFFPVFLITYYLVGKKHKNLVLLLFSIVFYAWGAPRFIFFLVGSVFINFYIVRAMYLTNARIKKKLWAALSIAINLGLLAYFKYANFFIDNFNFILESFGANSIYWTKVVLPIGISFFTFQSLTYTIDVYRKIHRPLKNPFDFLLYILMFPQMIAGPIVRFQTIADQITERRETNEDRLLGFYRFVIGLAKKVLIADVLAFEVDKIMAMDYINLDTNMAWIGIIGYAFQIYFDFSGYSDMAIGMGRMTGFKFPENFNNPYTSRSITEFWRRWHITLGQFMRDYLYLPLGGNRVSKPRLYFNLWVVFLISGLWHGADWNFVIWGAYHGLFLIADRVFLLKVYERIGKAPSILITFFITIVGWVFFRVEGFENALTYLERMFAFDFRPVTSQLNNHFYFIMLMGTIFSFITVFRFGSRMEDRIYKTKLNGKEHLLYFIVSVFTMVFVIASLAGSGFSPFIYFRF